MNSEEKLGISGTLAIVIGIAWMVAFEYYNAPQPWPNAGWLLYTLGLGWMLSLLAESNLRHGEQLIGFKNDPPLRSKILMTAGAGVFVAAAAALAVAPLTGNNYGTVVYVAVAALFIGCWTSMLGVRLDPDSPSIYDEPEAVGGDA